LEEGIARMARWAKTMGARKTKPFADVEVLHRMPPSWARELSPSVGEKETVA